MPIQYPDKRVMRTKEKLSEVLLDLMEEKSIDEITITEIVKRADFNRGTFYAHYEKKEDLLEEVVEGMFEQLTEAIWKPYAGLSVVDFNEIPASSIILFDHFLENKRFYRLMMKPSTTYPFHTKMIKELNRLFREEFEFPITENTPNIDIELFITYRIYGIIGIIQEWIESDFKNSSAYMADQLIQIMKFYTPTINIKDKGH